MEQSRIKILQNAVIGPGECAVITSPERIFYFSGIWTDDAILLIARNDALLIAESSSFQPEHQLSASCLLEETVDFSLQIENFAQKTNSGILIFDKMISLPDFDWLVHSFGEECCVKDRLLESQIRKQMSVKDSEELRYINEAASICQKAFDCLVPQLHTGQSELEISALLEKTMRELGANAFPFSTVVGSGSRSAFLHPLPTRRILQKGDLLVLDFGATVNGYCADISRTVALGDASPAQIAEYRLLVQAKNEAAAFLKNGTACCRTDITVQHFLACNGMPELIHRCGHGIGLTVHEAPDLYAKSDGLFASNMAICLETGVYRKNRYGIRVEDMYIVGLDGPQQLTKCPDELPIV